MNFSEHMTRIYVDSWCKSKYKLVYGHIENKAVGFSEREEDEVSRPSLLFRAENRRPHHRRLQPGLVDNPPFH